MVSDYFDYRRGVDREETFGSSRVLVEGLLTPKHLLAAGVLLFAVGFSLGLLLVAVRGWPIFILGVIGLLGGWFYTGGPVAYKYVALGDILVFILMGPLMVIGSYFALTGGFSLTVLYASLPVGCLVAAILHANNIRDMDADRAANKRTLAVIFGRRVARAEYILLVAGAYVMVAVMVAAGVMPWPTLIVAVTAPEAYRLIRIFTTSTDTALLHQGQGRTARLHGRFGLWLVIGWLVAVALSSV